MMSTNLSRPDAQPVKAGDYVRIRNGGGFGRVVRVQAMIACDQGGHVLEDIENVVAVVRSRESPPPKCRFPGRHPDGCECADLPQAPNTNQAKARLDADGDADGVAKPMTELRGIISKEIVAQGHCIAHDNQIEGYVLQDVSNAAMPALYVEHPNQALNVERNKKALRDMGRNPDGSPVADSVSQSGGEK